MRTEIFMEGRPLDITDEIDARFTYQSDDVRDFGSKNTNFSKTIKLPGTSNNNYYFGFCFEFTGFNPVNPALPNIGMNFSAGKAASAIVLVDGIQIFKGIIRLMEITIDNGHVEYQCVVYGELGGLAADIGNKLLQDLDFSVYNRQWNISTIAGSWLGGGGGGAGVYMPLIDYGNVSTNKIDFQFKAFRPALYVREYLMKILETAKQGYTYDFPFLDSALCKRLIVPHNEDK